MACEQRHRLLADYIERTHALIVEVELLLGALEKDRESDWTHRWFRIEQARINYEIARLAVGTHINVHRCRLAIHSGI